MSIVFDFVDIRSRMLGDEKPQPQKKEKKSKEHFDCVDCADAGWVHQNYLTNRWRRCPSCLNADNKDPPTLPP
jgi:hypothetical protein